MRTFEISVSSSAYRLISRYKEIDGYKFPCFWVEDLVRRELAARRAREIAAEQSSPNIFLPAGRKLGVRDIA